MRLIDADALFEVIKKSMDENPHIEETQRAMHIHEHKYFLTLLAGIPTIQPEPQEGHWINGKCDLCGEHAPFWCMASTYHESNYCPNCGARMKGKQDGH